MCSVAKDPYPRIATIGRRALSLIGVEQVVMKNSRFNSGGAHQGETSVPPSNFGMARSSSWFDMNSGEFYSLTFLAVLGGRNTSILCAGCSGKDNNY
jgi:regulator-associated protein of mTOR